MTTRCDDTRLAEAKAIPLDEVAERLGVADRLTRAGRERVGPCPVCGGSDRFGINPDKGVWNCRHGCSSEHGADGPGLVMAVRGCSFPEALTFLVGGGEVSPEERKRRAEAAARREADRARDAERRRQQAIASALAVWNAARPDWRGTPVEAYLRRRLAGAVPPLDARAIRYAPALRYTIAAGTGWEVVHEGPAMVAGVLDRSGDLVAVHRTWLDLDQPKGKAVITARDRDWPAKKVLGSKKGNAIRFSDARAEVLVMAEGIETTLTAMAAWGGEKADFWCGVDLGNMSGARLPEPGRGTTRGSCLPDMADRDAFVPPPWVRRLIYVQDGDSDPVVTRAKLVAGLTRAVRAAGVARVQIVPCPAGKDLNDLIFEEVTDATDEGE